MKKVKIIVAAIFIVAVGAGIFWACKKENNIINNNGIKTQKTLDSTSVGELHNQALSAYVYGCLETNELFPSFSFYCNYFNIDTLHAQNMHALELSVIDSYNNFSDYLDHLEDDGVYSSECVDALRQIFNEDISSYDSTEIENLILNIQSTSYSNSIENTLITDLCSILENSYHYWHEEQNLISWCALNSYFGGGSISNPAVSELALILCVVIGLDYTFSADLAGYLIHYTAYNNCEPANRDEQMIINESTVYAAYYSSEAARR